MNGYQGQLKGPFVTDQDIISLMKEQSKPFKYITSFGIIGMEKGSHIILNDKEIEIGKTGIYEIHNVELYSIKIKEATNQFVMIDYTIGS